MHIMPIKAIIFDLGGVLLNIDYQRTIDAFKREGVTDFEHFFTQAAQSSLFDQLDKGRISPGEFRNELRRLSGLRIGDEQIDAAWNAMLLDFPKERIDLLQGVRQHYPTFLLSNTNAIHYPVYRESLRREYGFSDLSQLFRKQYLSYELGMRKPDREIFVHVLEDQDLVAEETLFIDDSLQHVHGAREAGLKAVHLDTARMDVMDLFTSECQLREG